MRVLALAFSFGVTACGSSHTAVVVEGKGSGGTEPATPVPERVVTMLSDLIEHGEGA